MGLGGIVQRALTDFFESISSIDNITKLEDCLKPLLLRFGVHHFVCANMYGFECLADRKPLFGNWDSDWLVRYVSQGYYAEDPVSFYRNGLEGDGKPYYWTELIAEKELTSQQSALFRDAWDHGLREGLVIPLEISDDELAVASVAGRDFKRDLFAQSILHAIFVRAHLKARQILMRDYKGGFLPNRLAQSPSPQTEKITATELQVIALLAEGHRANDIAIIRGGSERTVLNHIARAKKKLLADTTPQLVYIARSYHLIT